MKIKPTRWKVLKTEAIDMNEDFLWFDDAPTREDLDKLKKHNRISQSFPCCKLPEYPFQQILDMVFFQTLHLNKHSKHNNHRSLLSLSPSG